MGNIEPMENASQPRPQWLNLRSGFSRLRALIPAAGLVVWAASLGLLDSAWSEAHEAWWGGCKSKPEVKFTQAFTNDDGLVNDARLDPHDNGIDPGYDKQVASCSAIVVEAKQVLVTVTNGYPSYTCRFWTEFKNTGCVSLKRKSPVIHSPSELTVLEVGGTPCCVLKPREEALTSFTVHVEQWARQGFAYQFVIDQTLIEVTKGKSSCK